jgi:hypothetical protein
MGLDVAIALVLPKPRANVYSFPDNVCNLNNLPISDEIAVPCGVRDAILLDA